MVNKNTLGAKSGKVKKNSDVTRVIWECGQDKQCTWDEKVNPTTSMQLIHSQQIYRVLQLDSQMSSYQIEELRTYAN